MTAAAAQSNGAAASVDKVADQLASTTSLPLPTAMDTLTVTTTTTTKARMTMMTTTKRTMPVHLLPPVLPKRKRRTRRRRRSPRQSRHKPSLLVLVLQRSSPTANTPSVRSSSTTLPNSAKNANVSPRRSCVNARDSFSKRKVSTTTSSDVQPKFTDKCVSTLRAPSSRYDHDRDR